MECWSLTIGADISSANIPSAEVHATMLDAILFAAIGLVLLAGLGATSRAGSLDRIDPRLWRHAHH